AVSRTAQIGRPSGIVFCVWSVRDLARGRASAATRNLTSLVSILSRMVLSSLGCELRRVSATLSRVWTIPARLSSWPDRLVRLSWVIKKVRQDNMAEAPITQRIPADLRRQIHEGNLVPGALLPSETEVASQYGVSRQTARNALQALEHEGLVVVRPRRGRIVRSSQRLRWRLSEF